jgi:CHAD domain-containing protein
MEEQLIPSQEPNKVESTSIPDSAAHTDVLPVGYEEGRAKMRELALRQLNRFVSYEAKVLKGDDADAIHDMRVGSRRLQQVLDLLYPKPLVPEIRRMRRQIRRCRQILGEVRNCDVLLEIVARSLGRKRSARREAWRAVHHYLRMRRSEIFLRAMRKLGKINLAGIYVDLKELMHQDAKPRQSAQNDPHLLQTPRPGLAEELSGALQLVWGCFEAQIDESHRDSHPEIIHGARIATKRLRYLLEVFHEFGVSGSADALTWLRQLQKDLGDWHDLVVLEEMMIEMLARREFLRDHLTVAMQVQKLIVRNRENKVGLEEKYFRMSHGSVEILRLKAWVSYLVASPSTALFTP